MLKVASDSRRGSSGRNEESIGRSLARSHAGIGKRDQRVAFRFRPNSRRDWGDQTRRLRRLPGSRSHHWIQQTRRKRRKRRDGRNGGAGIPTRNWATPGGEDQTHFTGSDVPARAEDRYRRRQPLRAVRCVFSSCAWSPFWLRASALSAPKTLTSSATITELRTSSPARPPEPLTPPDTPKPKTGKMRFCAICVAREATTRCLLRRCRRRCRQLSTLSAPASTA